MLNRRRSMCAFFFKKHLLLLFIGSLIQLRSRRAKTQHSVPRHRPVSPSHFHWHHHIKPCHVSIFGYDSIISTAHPLRGIRAQYWPGASALLRLDKPPAHRVTLTSFCSVQFGNSSPGGLSLGHCVS